MTNRLFALLALAALLYAPTSMAHHSFAAEFDYDLTGTIEGEVVEVLYVNPHARYFVEVEDGAGNRVLWDAQSRSPSALQRIGWTRDTLKAGERVAIEGNLGRDNTRKIWIREVTRSSGEVIRPTGDDAEEDTENDND
jgi:hypothetical protein